MPHFAEPSARFGSDDLGFEKVALRADGVLSVANTTSDDMCFWPYTSDTTGHPKGVVHLQPVMRFCAHTPARSMCSTRESYLTFAVFKLYLLKNGFAAVERRVLAP